MRKRTEPEQHTPSGIITVGADPRLIRLTPYQMTRFARAAARAAEQRKPVTLPKLKCLQQADAPNAPFQWTRHQAPARLAA